MIIEADLAAIKDEYNWKEAFAVACVKSVRNSTPWDKSVSVIHAEHSDVKRVIATANGVNDEANWVGVFELNDGRFVSISSWCDYTGWGCQVGGEMMVANSEEDIIRFGLNDGERERLGFPAIPNSNVAKEASQRYGVE